MIKREEKIDNILVIIACSVVAIFFIIMIFVIVDFKNDYDCSTTNNPNWYIEHNCQRYER